MQSEVAIRYAEGLFALALENDTVATKKQQAQCLAELFETNPELMTFFASVKITDTEKKAFAQEVFAKAADQEMINFIKLLIDKDRVYYLKEMLKTFIGLCNEHLGIEHAQVYSARALREEDLAKIKQALSAQSGKEVILENKIDPSLLAGIKVVMGNRVTDTTMKSRIDELKRTLLKGGQA